MAMNRSNKMLILAIVLIISGLYCIHNIYTGAVMGALAGGLTTNGFIALFGYFEMKRTDKSIS